MADPARLTVREKIGYGLGDTASNFFFQTFNIFLLYYYTDVVGLNAGAAGLIFLVTRVIDAVADPLMGMICDRTRSRYGKFRPYLLWMAGPYAVLGYLMFANPPWSPHGRLVYAYATYIGMMLAYTAINIPYSALVGVMSPSSAERTSLSTYRFILAFVGGLVITSTVSPLKNALGHGNEADGFRRTMAIFAALSVALFWFTFASTRERVQATDEPGTTWGRDLRLLFRNRPWLVLFVGSMCTLVMTGVRNGTIVYYFKYYVHDDGRKVFWWFDQTSLFMTTGLLALIAGVACTGWFERRWGKRRLMIVLVTGNALGWAAFFPLGPGQLGWMYAINLAALFLLGPTIPVVWSMYADTADFGEWRFRRRTTGLIFAAALFAQKFGLAIGGWLPGKLLADHGFVANAAQAPGALLAIRLAMSLVPAGFALLFAAVLCFYPISTAALQSMERELVERRQATAMPVVAA